jgi:superfamily II DNA or RNA helicase
MDTLQQGNILLAKSSIIIPIKSIKKSTEEINKILKNEFRLLYKPKIGYPKTVNVYKITEDGYLLLPKNSLYIGLVSGLIDYSRLVIPQYKTELEKLIDDGNFKVKMQKGDHLIDVIRYLKSKLEKKKKSKDDKESKKEDLIKLITTRTTKTNTTNIDIPISENPFTEPYSISDMKEDKDKSDKKEDKQEDIKDDKDKKEQVYKEETKESKIISSLLIKNKLIIDELEQLYEAVEDVVDEELYYPPRPKLFLNQEIVCDYLMNHIYTPILSKKQKKYSGCVLIAPTGEGKTHIMMGMFARIGGKMLIVVPNEVILNQTVEVARTAFNQTITDEYKSISKVPKVTTYYGKNKDDTGDIVVSIINTLLTQPATFFDLFTFVAFDEAPDYCSEQFSNIFWVGQAKCTLAVTATPCDRTDGFDKMLPLHVGPYIVAKDIPGFIASNDDFNFQFNLIKYEGDSEHTQVLVNEKSGTASSAKIINMICSDPYRLCLVVSRIQYHYRNKRHVYVFCDRRMYCHLIAHTLRLVEKDLNMYKPKEIENMAEETYIVMGGISTEELSDANNTKVSSSIIITTYSYLRRGVSIARMDTMVLASPRKSGLTQVIGRITRRGGDTSKIRIVDDIIDSKTILAHQVYDRISAYKLRNGEIKNLMKVKYNKQDGEILMICLTLVNDIKLSGCFFCDNTDNNDIIDNDDNPEERTIKINREKMLEDYLSKKRSLCL